MVKYEYQKLYREYFTFVIPTGASFLFVYCYPNELIQSSIYIWNSSTFSPSWLRFDSVGVILW